jgi:Ni2+-binding GTPase involved in maturation of urease and hydrogenase
MNGIRFLMVGGFLGAGKTTAIARLARHYIDHGHRIGLITNDQAYDLVDTHSLRAQGFRVGEVPGACFCCKFEDLVATARQLGDAETPDMIIAEPVGSCTDLVATVIEPLRHLHGDQYEIGPLTVLLKPEHGQKILRAEQGIGFSPKAAYIFQKQIEEADIVAVNKVDKLSEAQRDELIGLVNQQFPDKTVLAISARHGYGFQPLIDAINQARAAHGSFMEVDYDVYAEGEAELGWLNCQCQVSRRSSDLFALDDLVFHLVSAIRRELGLRGFEAVHLKVLGQANGQSAIANLVGSNENVERSLESGVSASEADLIVNARVAADPEILAEIVEQGIASVAEQHSLKHRIHGMQRFRPGRPMPTHRMGVSE